MRKRLSKTHFTQTLARRYNTFACFLLFTKKAAVQIPAALYLLFLLIKPEFIAQLF
jgi:hypothetical protein